MLILIIKVLTRRDIEREAIIPSNLYHSNIVIFHGACTLGSSPYPFLATTFHHVDGVSITTRSVLQGTANICLDEPQWLQVIRNVASALEYLHESVNVLHNDVKDDNIVLEKSCHSSSSSSINAVLIDFNRAFCNSRKVFL